MSKYLPAIEERFAHTIRTALGRIQALEARTAKVNSVAFLYARTGVVDPAYASGQPRVTFTGDAALSGPYQRLASYTPVASDLVAMLPVGKTYVLLGKLV